MPDVLKNLLNSEKGVMALLVIAATTLLFAIGRIEPTTEQWMEYSVLWLGIYTGGKTIQGAASAIANRPATLPGAGPTSVLTTGPTVVNPSSVEAEDLAFAKAPTKPLDPAKIEAAYQRVRGSQDGFVDSETVTYLAVAALLCVSLTLHLAACGWMKNTAHDVATSIVDCTKGEAKKAATELGPVVDILLIQAVDGNSKVDWAPVRDVAKRFSADVGGCVLADAVARALKPRSEDPQAPKISPLEVDRASLREGFRALSVELWKGASFKTDEGTL